MFVNRSDWRLGFVKEKRAESTIPTSPAFVSMPLLADFLTEIPKPDVRPTY